MKTNKFKPVYVIDITNDTTVADTIASVSIVTGKQIGRAHV